MDLRHLRAFSPPRPALGAVDLLVTRRVSEGLQSAPRLRVGLPSRGTSVPLVTPWARRLIFTDISQHARTEIPMNLCDPSAFSPPRPASGRGEQDQKVWVKMRHSTHAIRL